MTLKQLRKRLIGRDWVSAQELATSSGSDVKTIEMMMSHWVASGDVVEKTSCDHCNGCFISKCQSYCWCGKV
ncbi:MAG: hypothetical protein CMF42_01520 [Legionellales bacterium]|nr:hypothetical protein [Legionellales bacterium]|tara:strand:- start:1284 stop:1499 length:216 start_codon:yes stop_codon:yes gene_type:complete